MRRWLLAVVDAAGYWSGVVAYFVFAVAVAAMAAGLALLLWQAMTRLVGR